MWYSFTAQNQYIHTQKTQKITPRNSALFAVIHLKLMVRHLTLCKENSRLTSSLRGCYSSFGWTPLQTEIIQAYLRISIKYWKINMSFYINLLLNVIIFSTHGSVKCLGHTKLSIRQKTYWSVLTSSWLHDTCNF